jgi:hypothetical protein
LAESPEASEQTVMAIAGHVRREMLQHYSHVRQEAKRRAFESLDNVTNQENGRRKRTNEGMRKRPLTKGKNGRDGQI